ncbi:MAG: amidohydrolase [Bacteroidales bacterium]|nr:amidohydrolase [Bacteroidales bacterium]
MKIINTHAHLIEIEKVLQDGGQKYLSFLRDIPTFSAVEQVTAMLSVENLLQQMDEAGVEKSVLFAMYSPILFASNEFVAGICNQFPGRFTGFASVDIKNREAPDILEDAVKKLGLKGLKLHPPLQDFHPNDKAVWPIYEKARDLNIPVVFHVGTTPFGNLVKLSQANPVLLDEVANDFPDLTIILTHLGTLWHNESFMVTEKHTNVYIDTAAYPYEIKELLNENLIRRVGENKFIFGTDFPMPYEGKMHRIGDFVDCIKALDISGELKEMIFYVNFENLMKSRT